MHISPIRKGNFQMHLIQNIQSPNPNESCYGSLSDYDNRTHRAMAKLCEAAGESCQICPVHMCQCLGWPIAQPVKLRPSATVAMVCQSKSPASEGSNQFLAPFRSAQPCKKSKKPKVCSGGDVEAKKPWVAFKSYSHRSYRLVHCRLAIRHVLGWRRTL